MHLYNIMHYDSITINGYLYNVLSFIIICDANVTNEMFKCYN